MEAFKIHVTCTIQKKQNFHVIIFRCNIFCHIQPYTSAAAKHFYFTFQSPLSLFNYEWESTWGQKKSNRDWRKFNFFASSHSCTEISHLISVSLPCMALLQCFCLQFPHLFYILLGFWLAYCNIMYHWGSLNADSFFFQKMQWWFRSWGSQSAFLFVEKLIFVNFWRTFEFNGFCKFEKFPWKN